MRFKFALLFFFISVMSFGQSQKQIDSLLLIHDKTQNEIDKINILNNVGRLYGSGNIEKASFYNNKAISISKELDYPRGIAYGYLFLSASIKASGNYQEAIKNLKKGVRDLDKYDFPKGSIELNTWIAGNFTEMRQYDSAKVYLNNSISRAKKIDYYQGLITTYIEYGGIYQSQDNYKKALEYFIKVDSICTTKTIKNDPDCAIAVSNIGLIKGLFKEFDEAEKYYKLALDYFERLKTQKKAAINTINSLGTIELERNNFDKAEKYYKEALEYYIASKRKSEIGYMYSQFANLYGKQKRYYEAENVALKSIEISKDLKDSLRIIYGLNVLGSIKIDQKEFNKSIIYTEESLEIAKRLKKPSMVLKSLNLLNKVYFKSKNYKKAAETAIIYANYKDSIDVLQNKKVLLDIETKYQTEKKEKEIALLKSEKELNAQKQKNQRNLLLGGLGITSIVGLFLFVLYRNRHKTNTKLKELDTLKSNFFANISHEFRTPLTLISSAIDDTLTDDSISDKKRQQFSVAKQNSERLLSLVNQLLDLSKIDAGQLKLHLQESNVLQLISALSESFTHSAKQKNINLNLNIKQREENVWFDKDAVEKITVNLLSNALKYTPENGSVVCHASIENHKLVLQVKNTGTGLTYEESNHIFDRFYQTNEQNQGTGIGLALVKELVELHKGTIEVTSTPNEWTSFKVILTIDKNSFKDAIISSTTNNDIQIDIPSYSGSTVVGDDDFVDSELPILLIVEDNDDLRNLLKQTFDEQYNVMTASNGQIGIDLTLEHIPDLIISDIMMPEKDGVALTNTLKNDERSAHIPIILLTAKADVESKFTGIDTGADDYITKPFDKKLLVLKVEKLIESRKKLQARYSQEVILKPKDIAFTNLDELFLNKVQIVLDNQLVESSFSVEDFSKAVGMSRMQLHRKIKALTGLSASEFIRSQRLKLAAQLLKQSDINISQVGYSVGFNDHAYFSKCFKDTYKCTPTEYAKKS